MPLSTTRILHQQGLPKWPHTTRLRAQHDLCREEQTQEGHTKRDIPTALTLGNTTPMHETCALAAFSTSRRRATLPRGSTCLGQPWPHAHISDPCQNVVDPGGARVHLATRENNKAIPIPHARLEYCVRIERAAITLAKQQEIGRTHDNPVRSLHPPLPFFAGVCAFRLAYVHIQRFCRGKTLTCVRQDCC